jgi:hypothetical protein
MAPRSSLLAIAAATLLLSGCGEEKVAAYRVPKEKDPMPPAAAASDAASDAGAQPDAAAPAPAGPAMADTAVPTADTALVWKAPDQWVSKPAAQFRKATYAVPGDAGDSDLSITAFPGEAGGELANVNRWRSQLALPALGPDELEGAVTRVEANGLKFTIVEIAPRGDPAGKGMIGAMVPVGGSTWFFKLMGPGPSVKSAKPAFVEFLHTVRAP